MLHKERSPILWGFAEQALRDCANSRGLALKDAHFDYLLKALPRDVLASPPALALSVEGIISQEFIPSFRMLNAGIKPDFKQLSLATFQNLSHYYAYFHRPIVELARYKFSKHSKEVWLSAEQINMWSQDQFYKTKRQSRLRYLGCQQAIELGYLVQDDTWDKSLKYRLAPGIYSLLCPGIENYETNGGKFKLDTVRDMIASEYESMPGFVVM